MDFSEDWKSLWPVGSVYSAPLLLEQNPPPSKKRRRLGEDDEEIVEKSDEEIGPLKFIPCSESLVELFCSPALSPRLPPPYPRLSLSRFLQTTGSLMLLSTSSCIASEFGPQFPETNYRTHDHSRDSYFLHGFNRLQLLPCSIGSSCNNGVDSVLAFFPFGDNCDQVGYMMLYSKDDNQRILVAKHKLNSRIVKLLVNPVVEFDDSALGGASSSSCFAIIGYLMACSMFSVHWYVVKTIKEHDGFQVKSAWPDFVGSKLFRSTAIVHACWSPHLCEEAAVLLETGDLYLFDLSPCLKKPLSVERVGRKKLQVGCDANNNFDNRGGGCWLSCEFSWHPRVLIVSHTNAVFLVDARSKGCKVSCIMKIEMLSTVQNDSFTALSRASSDGFSFCLASKNLLLLCDVRKRWRPVLQWVHNLDNPHYITVFRLSELRSKAKDEKYRWASESGSCILLGSFWDTEFNLFIHGPNNSRRSIISEISKFCNSCYAWGLPSELSLSGRDSNCGWCPMREEFFRDSLPDWIDWRQKRDIVLGFGILGDHISHLSKPDSCGGFLMIRLMSSGRLEAQSYHASWENHIVSDDAHKDMLLTFEDNVLYEAYDHNYDSMDKFPQRLKLEYLRGYLKGNLSEALFKKLKQLHRANTEKQGERESSEKLETNGPTELISVSRIFDVVKGVNLPTSIHEIALKIIWEGLILAFSSQSRYQGILSFLDISRHMAQFPFSIPSFYPNKLLHNTRASDDLVDLFPPLEFLLTLLKLRSREFIDIGKLDEATAGVLEADSEIKLQSDRIIEVAYEIIGSSAPADSELDLCHAISLSDDTDELVYGAENLRNISFHKPVALLDEIFMEDTAPVKSCSENEGFTNFVFKKCQEVAFNVDTEMVGLELLNMGCPLQLKFGDSDISFGEKELKAFKLLKQQDLNFQKGFQLYQDYSTRVD